MNRMHIATSTAQAAADLLSGLVPVEHVRALAGVQISDLTLDSREVREGTVFVALRGTREHGLEYAQAAVEQGAAIVLYEAPATAPSLSVPTIGVPNLREAIGAIADRFFDSPSQAMQIAAVTGTNGKTTTAWLIASAMERLGASSAYAGTLGVGALHDLRPRAHTTPDCITVHRELAALRDRHVRALGMEVSSHALDQSRIAGVRVATAVFTNLTRDHLDYHGTFEAYGEAKAKLLRWPQLRHAVINADDEFGRILLERHAGDVPLIAYSRAALLPQADVRALVAERVTQGERGLELSIAGDFGSGVLRSRLIGDFNAENLLAALGVLLSWDVELPRALEALAHIDAPPGRMQTLTRTGRALAVVDYAHTPDALAKALRAARAHCTGQLFCVFGCGGERDPGKRPLMGRIAAELADRVIVTDDNPRGEDGAQIASEIVSGMGSTTNAHMQRDRKRAIRLALDQAQAGDVVLVAGKGHEDYQIIGTERRHFSDAEVIAQWLEERRLEERA